MDAISAYCESDTARLHSGMDTVCMLFVCVVTMFNVYIAYAQYIIKSSKSRWCEHMQAHSRIQVGMCPLCTHFSGLNEEEK